MSTARQIDMQTDMRADRTIDTSMYQYYICIPMSYWGTTPWGSPGAQGPPPDQVRNAARRRAPPPPPDHIRSAGPGP